MADTKKKLQNLIDLFRKNIDRYKAQTYDEANTRVDFIDKFFELLGWDVRNLNRYSEDYRDVVREDKVTIAGKPKAPDYSFRIGGHRKFFVEAKKPAVNIKEDVEPSYQVRRYGYTAKLPLSILTDFEEFAVYDTRIKPDKNDKASVARIFYCTFDEYHTHFDFIRDTFSKEAILKGSFDRYVVENKKKKGTNAIDAEFLELIDGWRNDLATNIALRNNELDIYELNHVVQKIIDRLIFLRIAEDRGSEQYGTLKRIAESDNVYGELLNAFKRADEKYNSGLFAQEKIFDALQTDDKKLVGIIKYMYYPDCPYEFSVLRVDILGHIYEQFLGKTIRLTSGHRAKVEEKPEVRKAGGVYYTPQYIVDYIVEHTVGEKVKRLTPKKVADLSVLDPACGSGSFLIGAYEYLLQWHLDYYTDKERVTKSLKESLIYPVTNTTYRLTIREKKRILVNNIYGVDIDAQAVEVTKLSLLLKLMEGETGESAGELFMVSAQEKLLPDLESNVKCGNSLIGSDFYEGRDLGLFDNDAMRKINVFDWEKAFPAVFEKGGFDCVIGNPPYVLIEDVFRDDAILDYFRKEYDTSYKVDTYHVFLRKGLVLLREAGLLGYITPSNYLTNNGLKSLRVFLLKNAILNDINVIDGKVFANASVDTCITILLRTSTKNKDTKGAFTFSAWQENQMLTQKTMSITNDMFYDDKYFLFSPQQNVCIRVPVIPLGELFFVKFGMQLRDRKKYPTDVITLMSQEDEEITTQHKPCYTGKNVNRYSLEYAGLMAYVNAKAKRGGCWDFNIHEKNPKIIVRQIGVYPICALDTEGYYCLNTVFMIVPKEEKCAYKMHYILGLINSRFMRFYWGASFSDMRQTFPKIKGTYLKELPIPIVNFELKQEKANHDKLVTLVDQMLEAQKTLHAAKTSRDKELAEKRVTIIDTQIDALVYKLYGLTEEEIAIVEEKA